MSEESLVVVGVPANAAPKIKIKDMTPQQRRAYNNEASKRSKSKKRRTGEEGARFFDSELELSTKEAVGILTNDRLIRNQHVAKVCVDLAQVAARCLRIPFNTHLLTHGVQQTLLAREKGEAVEPLPIEDAWKPGERIRHHELRALWDYSTSWRTQPDGTKLSFDKWLELRRLCITDVYNAGNVIFGMDLHDKPHGEWSRELFVQKNPDLLPEDYTWEDIKKAFAAQSDIHQRLLISARSSYKSSFNIQDLISWVLAFSGECRILVLSSTKPLSRGFVKKFRGIFTVKNSIQPTLFNQLWAEHCIAPDQGEKTSYTSPMRRLELIEPTLTSSSLESEGQAGVRTDLLVLEDVAEISNSSNPEQREKTLEKVDMLRELVEPFGFLQIVGTPISGGTEGKGDIYQTFLEREEKRDIPGMLYKICPCWTVNPDVHKEPFDPSLTANDVTLLFPKRLTFPILKAKLLENVKVFRQQSLCSWVPDEDSEIKLNFERALLNKCVTPMKDIPAGPNYLVGDASFSDSNRADNAVYAVVRIAANPQGLKSMYVLTVEAARMRVHEQAEVVARLWRQFDCKTLIMERLAAWDLIGQEISRTALKYGVNIPIYWVPVDTSKDAKKKRLKSLEGILYSGQFLFCSGIYTEGLFNELEALGSSGSGRRRDDRGDALSVAQRVLLPSTTHQRPEDLEATKKLQAEQREQEIKREQYNRYFGNSTPPRPAEPPAEPQQQPNRTGFASLPSGMRSSIK